MTRVEIEYCVPCKKLPMAEKTQHVLLSQFGNDLDEVALKTGRGGVFKVRVDGEEVYDQAKDGFDVDEIMSRVRESVELPTVA